MMKALVVDWLDKYGGAERVIATLNKKYNFDKTYTLINVMKSGDLDKIYPNAEPIIEVTMLQYINKYFRIFFPFFPFLISSIKMDKNVKLIISSSHCVAKGIKKSNNDQVHISYFQARNFKYIWEEASLYFGKLGFVLNPLFWLLRKYDVKQAQRPDFIIANSKFVQAWIKKNYKRDSVVIYPPVDLNKFNLELVKEEYYVTVGRLVAYKRFDIIIDAFNRNGKKLIVIGDGNMRESLEDNSKDNIVFTGFLEADLIHKHISKAKGFIHAGVEDFGIAPLEAQACGTPVIAFGEGGVLETVQEGITGVYFQEQTHESLNKSILEFETKKFDSNVIRDHALQFSEENFLKNFDEFLKATLS